MNPYYTNNTAFLGQQSYQPTMSCYTCHNYPAIPMQCRTCGTIRCFECFKAAPQYCQAACRFADFIPMNPQNDAQYQQVVTLRCRDCLQYYNISESTDHANQCSARSKTNFNTNPMTLKQGQNCRYCNTFCNPINLPAHEAQYVARNYSTSNDYVINDERRLVDISYEEKPRLTLCHKICTSITGLLSLVAMVVTFYFAIKLIFFGNPQFQVLCVGQVVTDEGICLFAFGQFAVGIITISQVGVGLIHIGQAGIGLLFSVGQVTSGIGFSIGQLASATYVYRAQLGMAFWAIGKAQCGFEFLRALVKRQSPVVMSCAKKTEVRE